MKREMLLGSVVSLVVSVFAGGIAAAAEPQDSKSLSRISADFSTFAGSTANSTSLATGLRTGSPITLTSTDAKGVITETTFSPPTGKMGNGNVFISLALAKQNLANAGITQPTPEQIQAALTNGPGGTITLPNGSTQPLTGVLTYRAQGMGWGKIAQTYGYKLGPVISAMKSGNTQAGAPAPAQLPAAAATKGSSGVTSASGASTSGVTTAAGSSHGQGNALGKGITTGAGGAAGQGNGNAYGRGITTGAGTPPGQSGAAGQGKGKGG
jgi:hypothetical protein